MLKGNGYQESIISKNFKRITNNHSLFQSQQQMQATDHEHDIKMQINLTYVAKRMKLRNSLGKQVTTLVGIRTKLLIWINSWEDHKETAHSLRNRNHINKISYLLLEIWLRLFLVTYLCHTRRF